LYKVSPLEPLFFGKENCLTQQPSPAQPGPRRPKKKFGTVVLWENAKGLTITLDPRRYFDTASGQWKDAGFYRPVDLHELIFNLEMARKYVYDMAPAQNQQDAGPEQP
jgi:hypothetical protein